MTYSFLPAFLIPHTSVQTDRPSHGIDRGQVLTGMHPQPGHGVYQTSENGGTPVPGSTLGERQIDFAKVVSRKAAEFPTIARTSSAME